MEKFINLHTHSDYSNFRLRDSINNIKDLIDYAIELGHNGIGITEHETIASSIDAQKYYKKIKQDNPDFKLVLGNEIYLCRNGLSKDNFVKGSDKYYHFILLAKDLEGHKQIRQLSTRAWDHSYMSFMMRVPTYYSDLQEIIGVNPGHVIGSTACLGGFVGSKLLGNKTVLLNDNYKQSEFWNKLCGWIRNIENIFGKGNFFIELQPSVMEDQIFANKYLIELSKDLDIPYIITTDAHYLKKEDKNIHKAYLNSQDGDREVDDFYNSTYMMSTEEIHQYLDQTLGAEAVSKGLQNTQLIYDMCEDYDLLRPLKIPYMPLDYSEPNQDLYNKYKNKLKQLEQFYLSEDSSERHLAREVLKAIDRDEQYRTDAAYQEIDKCLEAVWNSSVKMNTHWAAYLLNVSDYIKIVWDKGNSLVGPSRGSGGGFILLNMLGITQINPLRENTKTFFWRFMNPERVSPLDIDIDIEGSKRSQVFKAFQDQYGADRVSKVLTLRTEKSKSAIQTACRGLNYNNDIGLYLSSLIPSERGMLWTLKECFYGDEENDKKPIPMFVKLMTETYPDVWKVAVKIEGLINGVGSHAGGIIFVDEDFTESTALMKTNNGDVVTQYDLHMCEDVGLIKIDLLSIEALDKIRVCLDLLMKYGYIEHDTLYNMYENTIGIYKIERNDKEMWKMLWDHKVLSLFQMEQDSGIRGITLTSPSSVDDLATINSVMRLMASEKGAEQPLELYAKYKNNINLWYDEMRQHNLTEDEIQWLRGYLDISFGICETQEKLMSIIQDERVGGHSLLFADRLRKSIAKKKPKEFLECEKEFFETIEKKNLSRNLANYVWNVVFKIQRGYSFCAAHTLAYSLVGLQELNLAYKFPIIFWNCANLIVDSAGMDEEDNFEELIEDFTGKQEVIEETEDDDEEDDDDDELTAEEKKKEKEEKKKNKSVNYGKISAAIGKMISYGINISLPDINKSDFTFTPDVENNTILFGIKGIARVNSDLAKAIINGRPFNSLEDFLNRIKLNKLSIINLIKAGCFDRLEGKPRVSIMKNYINSISGQKNKLTLQNMAMLIREDCIPEDFKSSIHVYNFNKYLKNFKNGIDYILDERALNFYSKKYDMDLVQQKDDGQFFIKQKDWDKIYKKEMEDIKDELKNNPAILNNLNNKLFNSIWLKYANGSISKWEMDSVNFYYHEHELAHIDKNRYYISDYTCLSEEPEVEKTWTNSEGIEIPLFKLNRICGTVIDKDKNKNLVVLLTDSGVVNVKIYRAQFSKYDKQISVKNEITGKKTVIEKSWFSRGNKLMIVGIRRGDTFVPKIYKNHPTFDYPIELITDIDSQGIIEVAGERAE